MWSFNQVQVASPQNLVMTFQPTCDFESKCFDIAQAKFACCLVQVQECGSLHDVLVSFLQNAEDTALEEGLGYEGRALTGELFFMLAKRRYPSFRE